MQTIYEIVWSPALIVLLIAAGIYFTIRTGFVQLRMLPSMFRVMFERKNSENKGRGLSSFESFCLSLSGRVGTGNIVGVATAIAFGGPGSVFWMWLLAIFGAATAFVEATLAQKYKDLQYGQMRGGPFSYIEKALKQRHLAIVYAVFCIFGYGALMVGVQSNSVACAFDNSFSIPPVWTAAAVAVLLFFVVVGGMKRITQFTSVVAPLMAVGYIVISLVIIVVNFKTVPGVVEMIFQSAFGFSPVFGGMAGSAISIGIRRGLFSNEAGQGTGAIVAASADSEHPAQQGLTQALSVYADTLVVCTATALMILCTGNFNVFDAAGNAIVENVPELGANYVAFTQASIDSILPGAGGVFVSIALAFFVFTTLVACYFYSESGLLFLFRSTGLKSAKLEKTFRSVHRILFFAMVVLGAILTTDEVWTIGDIGVGLTTWVNVIALIILCPEAVACLKDYENK